MGKTKKPDVRDAEPRRCVATDEGGERRRLGPNAVFGLCLGLSGWLSLSRFQRLHDADSLLVSIISYTQWTPLYWRQNRYGMLWPLVCGWIKHPLLNVVAVMFCNVTFGLLAHFLLAHLLWRGKGPWKSTGLLSILATFAAGSGPYIFATISPLNFMTTPLAIGCIAIYWIRCVPFQSHYAIGAALALSLVAWYNPAAPIMLFALVLWLIPWTWVDRPAAPESKKTALLPLDVQDKVTLGLVAASCVLGVYMMRCSPWHNPVFDERLPIMDTLGSFWQMTAKIFASAGSEVGAPCLASAACAGVCCVVVAASLLQTKAAFAAARTMAAGLCAAITYGLLISNNAWARHEGLQVRYFFPVLFVATTAVCVGLIGLGHSLRALARAARTESQQPHPADSLFTRLKRLVPNEMGGLAVASIALLIGLRFGLPSYAGVEEGMHLWAGKIGEELLENEATHVAGRYWQAWPSSFYATWQHYVKKDGKMVFALTHRMDPTVPLWPSNPATWRIGVLKDSLAEARMYIAGTGVRNSDVKKESASLIIVTPQWPPKPEGG